MTDSNQLKTGTTTLGIVCKDGIIVAADRRMTAGYHIFAEGVEKVIPINDRMVLTIAGGVADANLLVKLTKAETRLAKLKLGRHNTAKEAASMLGNLVFNNIRSLGGITHFVFAARNNDNTFELHDIFPDGTVTKVAKYICSGSGSPYAEGVIEAAYKKDMSVAEGITLAKKAINTAIQKDSASGNGADIYKLTVNGVEKVESIIAVATIQ
jgi:proteasome beta subunit